AGLCTTSVPSWRSARRNMERRGEVERRADSAGRSEVKRVLLQLGTDVVPATSARQRNADAITTAARSTRFVDRSPHNVVLSKGNDVQRSHRRQAACVAVRVFKRFDVATTIACRAVTIAS